MKKNYWIYIVVIVLLMGGVIAGLVIGINNANNSNDNSHNNNIISPTEQKNSHKNRTIPKPSQPLPLPKQQQQKQKKSIQQMFQLLETFTDFEKDSTFGVSLSGDGISKLYVGEPGYQSYGKVKVFRVHDQKYKTLDLVKEVEFTNYGSKFQKAGYKIQGCLVAAPDHESKGAIFRINPNVNHSAQVSIERVDNYHSQHSMVKYGDMFQYRPPYLFTVTQSGHNKCQRIEIYHENQHSLAQVLESPIQSQQEQNLFGYSLQINDVNTRMTVLDPYENTFYVYETIKKNETNDKNERKRDNNNQSALYTLTQTVSLDDLYQDKQDLSQQMVMDYAGQRLILVSPENNLITLYIAGKQFKLQQQWTFPNIAFVTMEPSGQYLALYSETNNVCTLYHWCSDNFLYQLLQKWTIHHVLDMHWQNQQLFVSTPDSLLWFGVESEE